MCIARDPRRIQFARREEKILLIFMNAEEVDPRLHFYFPLLLLVEPLTVRPLAAPPLTDIGSILLPII